MDGRRLLRWALPALVLGVSACGSGSDNGRSAAKTPTATGTATATATPTPGGSAGDREPVTERESAVIRGWSESLLHGRVSRAARYFALPSVVSNGSPLARIETRAQAEQFNRALSCGARVVSLERSIHHYVIAKFELAERPGGNCGSGTGNPAWTAFRIRAGHIVQWLRVPDPGGGSAGADPGTVS